MIHLIPRADDAGVTAGTNEAIYRTTREGIIRNVGLMVPTPEFEAACKLFAPLADEIDLGIHATITSEWDDFRWGPVSDPRAVASLLEPDGTFRRSPRELQEGFDVGEMAHEVENQITRALDAGLRPRYLDTHMVFNWLPGAQDALDALGRKYDLIVDHPERFPGLPRVSLQSDDPLELFRARVAAAESGKLVKLITHPSRADADSARMRKADSEAGAVAAAREREAGFLVSPELADLIASEGVELLRYSEAAARFRM